MPLRNGEHGYGAVTKLLHWVTFSLILGQFLVGYTMSTDDPAAEAGADRADAAAERCAAADGSETAEAEEERCEEGLERREDALDDRADDALGTAWDDLWSGDLLAGGVTSAELHVLLGLAVLVMGVARVTWRRTGGLPPWADALTESERLVEGWTEKILLSLLFLIPVSGFLLVTVGKGWLGLHLASHLAFFAAVGTHVVLVLKHTVIQRDRHLARML